MARLSRRQVFDKMIKMRIALVAPPGYVNDLTGLRNSGYMQPKQLSGKNEVFFPGSTNEWLHLLHELADRFGYDLVKREG